MDFITQLYSSNLELAGIILGVVNVFLLTLAAHPRVQWFNWPAAFASTAIYLYLFFEWNLFGNAVLQVPFLMINLVGMWSWRHQLFGTTKDTRGEYQEVFTSYATNRQVMQVIGICLVASIPLTWFLASINDLAPFPDALILTFSLGASYFQLKKNVQSWWLWIFVDAVAVPMHFATGHPATAMLYFIYGAVCVVGLLAWHKEAKIHETRPLVTA